MSMPEAEAHIGQVVEGVHTVKQALTLAGKYKVELPICEQINLVIEEKISLKQAVTNLLARKPKEES
jgi:glycerol-3-phosphate dehydrogenase (NAD(P)+)